MQKITVKEAGFEGILYPGDGSKNKIMIVLSGSNGGMKLTAECAEFYHRNGIPALAVAMFNTKQTSKGLVSVPSHFISEGLAMNGISKNPSGTSCWSYKGQELPFAPYKCRKINPINLLF